MIDTSFIIPIHSYTMPDDIALSNISCRILVLSSSASQATSFISRTYRSILEMGIHSTQYSFSAPGVQSHNGIQPTPKATEPSEENIPTNAQAPSSGLVKIPWTITNRYYSALVHFAVHALHGLSAHQIQNVPAVIFVWAKGEVCQFSEFNLPQLVTCDAKDDSSPTGIMSSASLKN